MLNGIGYQLAGNQNPVFKRPGTVVSSGQGDPDSPGGVNITRHVEMEKIDKGMHYTSSTPNRTGLPLLRGPTRCRTPLAANIAQFGKAPLFRVIPDTTSGSYLLASGECVFDNRLDDQFRRRRGAPPGSPYVSRH